MARWLAQNRRSLAELLDNGPDPATICVETLDYDFGRIAGLILEFGLSVCLDIGHLLVGGRNVADHLDRWMDRTRVFHVHGVDAQGKDHVSLAHLPKGLLQDLAARLGPLPQENPRVVTMEVFGEEDFEESMAVIAEELSTWLK